MNRGVMGQVPTGGSLWPQGVVDGVDASQRPCRVIKIGTGLDGDLGHHVLGLVLSKVLPEATGTHHVYCLLPGPNPTLKLLYYHDLDTGV